MTSRPYRMAILSFALGLLYFGSFVDYGINFADEGALVSQMSRFAAGDRLYQDFHIGDTPGVYLLHGAIMKASGHSLLAGRWVLATTLAVSMALLYLLGWHFTRRRWLSLAAPLLYLASVPIYQGQFASSNIPYPVWYNVPLWLGGMLALLKFGEGKGLRWLLLTGVLAGINFAFKPNVGLFQLAAASLVTLAVLPMQGGPDAGRWKSKLNRLLWWGWWLAILLGLAVVFGGRAGLREFWILLAPASVASLLVAWRAALLPSPQGKMPSLLMCAATLALSFLAVNAPWMIYYYRVLGPQRFLERALFFGADFEKFYFISHPPVLLGALAGLGMVILARALPRRVARLGMPTDMFLLLAAALASVAGGLLLAGRPMPEGFYNAVTSVVEPAAFAAVILAHWLGLWVWARSIGTDDDCRTPSLNATVLVTGAVFLYMQIYPRTDFMHWVTSAPVSILLGVVLLAGLARRWEQARGSRLPTATVTALIFAPLFAIGAIRAGHSLGAIVDLDGGFPSRPQTVSLASERAPVRNRVGVAATYGDLSALVKFVRTNTAEDERIFTFPSLDVVSFLAGRPNTTRHGYFFPGWPGREVEAEVISDLDAAPPRFVVVYHWHPLFFSQAALYYFQLQHYIESNYRPYARFGRYVVLTHKTLGPAGDGPDLPRSSIEAALPYELDQELKGRLTDPDAAVRLEAVKQLEGFHLVSDYPPLSKLLGDPDQAVRNQVVWAYRYARDKTVARNLVAAVAGGLLSPRENILALRSIGGGVAADSAPDLLSLVDSPDMATAWAAQRGLFMTASRDVNGSFWFGSPPNTNESDHQVLSGHQLNRVLQWLDDPSAGRPLRYYAVTLGAEALEHSSPGRQIVCRPSLAAISRDADLNLRLLALRTMVRYGCAEEPDILNTAYNLMLFDNRMVVRLAEDLLKKTPEADQLLADMIHVGQGPRLESAIWLASVYGGPRSATELVPVSGHADPDIRLASVWALGRTGNAGHADHLALAQLDSDADVSEMAGRALAMLRRRLD